MSGLIRISKRLGLAALMVTTSFSANFFHAASAQSRAVAGEFSTILDWPKVAEWSTSTDASARDSGSNSVIEAVPTEGSFTGDPGVTFRGILGKIEGRTGPVGFVRATTAVAASATGFDSVALALGSENAALEMTVLLQDASQVGSAEWFEASVTQPRGLRTGIGFLLNSGFSIIRFSDFKRVLRGVEVPGRPIDPSTLRGFGIQLARSIQPVSLRDGGDIPFRIVLATAVSAVNTTKESVAAEIVESAALRLERAAYQRASQTLDSDELLAIQKATDQLFAGFSPRLLTSQELDQVFASPMLLNIVRFPQAGGNGRPIPSPPPGILIGDEQERLDMLADIRSIMRAPEATKIWLRSLMIDFALTMRPTPIVDEAGKLRLDRNALRSYLDSRLRQLGFRTKVKTEAFPLPNGSFGLSKELIQQGVAGSVVFDQSPFSARVGEFSFPIIALYYASVFAEIPESEKLGRRPFRYFFSAITSGSQLNQFTGWRLWQRMFANQDAQVAGSINSLDWWRVLVQAAVK